MNNNKIKRLKNILKKYKNMTYYELARLIEKELDPEEYRYAMIKLLNYEIKELEKGDK